MVQKHLLEKQLNGWLNVFLGTQYIRFCHAFIWFQLKTVFLKTIEIALCKVNGHFAIYRDRELLVIYYCKFNRMFSNLVLNKSKIPYNKVEMLFLYACL